MAVELRVPQVGESVTEVQIGEWLKKVGDPVHPEETLVMIETDKVTVELPAPAGGKILEIRKGPGESAEVGEVIGLLEEGAVDEAPPERARGGDGKEQGAPRAPSGAPPRRPQAAPDHHAAPAVMPAARRLMAEHDIDPAEVKGSGRGGRILKEDVQRTLDDRRPAAPPARVPQGRAPSPPAPQVPPAPVGDRLEEAVKMTPLRRRIAERLVNAQQTAALLTTFNEVDMSAVMELRRAYKDTFLEEHGVKLGFMSFFVKAAVEALKAIPAVNAQIRGDEIVYHNYYDIGVAVGSGKGLVVPVVRNAERLSFAEVEIAIADLARRAQEGKLTLEELQGGTFTISNGGIYGSMMSTPIINPPQSGILGMHAIMERPVAVKGQVVVRPMMYLALTYDHRIVDGREAVTFLRRIKDCIEEPSRILLEI